MRLVDAIEVCHVRSAIYRRSNPSKRYWKNYPLSLWDQIMNLDDRRADDWEEYDPRDRDEHYETM